MIKHFHHALRMGARFIQAESGWQATPVLDKSIAKLCRGMCSLPSQLFSIELCIRDAALHVSDFVECMAPGKHKCMKPGQSIRQPAVRG